MGLAPQALSMICPSLGFWGATWARHAPWTSPYLMTSRIQLLKGSQLAPCILWLSVNTFLVAPHTMTLDAEAVCFACLLMALMTGFLAHNLPCHARPLQLQGIFCRCCFVCADERVARCILSCAIQQAWYGLLTGDVAHCPSADSVQPHVQPSSRPLKGLWLNCRLCHINSMLQQSSSSARCV